MEDVRDTILSPLQCTSTVLTYIRATTGRTEKRRNWNLEPLDMRCEWNTPRYYANHGTSAPHQLFRSGRNQNPSRSGHVCTHAFEFEFELIDRMLLLHVIYTSYCVLYLADRRPQTRDQSMAMHVVPTAYIHYYIVSLSERSTAWIYLQSLCTFRRCIWLIFKA